MNKTKIEWTDETYNPVTGCTPISDGCKNCYAARMAKRLAGRYGYPKDDPFKVTLHPDRLDEPLHWKKPRRIFVCSMGDLFHEDVPFEFILQIHGLQAKAWWHTFLMLTKRPSRAIEFYQWATPTKIYDAAQKLSWPKFAQGWVNNGVGWNVPESNRWLGVTAENQATADERIPLLLQCPAAMRFVNIEPMLSEISFRWAKWCSIPFNKTTGKTDELDGLRMLDWIILGGETGPGARPMNPAWARSVRDQCVAANVPFFFKH